MSNKRNMKRKMKRDKTYTVERGEWESVDRWMDTQVDKIDGW
jgi:hypothetical protein